MASRERKRAARQKRKQRSVERRQTLAERREAMSARTEAKNAAAREALEPLREDERPTVVTIGAVISALIAALVIAGYVAGVEVEKLGSDGISQGESRAPLLSVLAVAALMATMAYGMWRSRYWAVLGFQALLAIVLVMSSIGLIGATRWVQGIGNLLLIAGGGAMFFFMIKAMARIQMPERAPRGE